MQTVTIIPPEVWGPRYWYFFHLTLELFPIYPSPVEQEHFYDFLKVFLKNIPCDECRTDFIGWVTQNPPPVNNGSNLLKSWGTDAHNAVNQKLGKPLFFGDVRYDFLTTPAISSEISSSSSSNDLFFILLWIFVGFLMGLVLFAFLSWYLLGRRRIY